MHCDIYLDMNILSIWILQSSKYSNFFSFAVKPNIESVDFKKKHLPDLF